jgi:lysophospholipase L1-like esterase
MNKNKKKLSIGALILGAIGATFGGWQMMRASDSNVKVTASEVQFRQKGKVGRLNRNLRIVAFGDSITWGLTYQPGHVRTHGQSYATYVFKHQKSFVNASISGSGVIATPITTKDFTHQLNQNIAAVSKADIITVAFGTNEYSFLDTAQQDRAAKVLNANIAKIRALNPHAELIGILPIDRWQTGDAANSTKGILQTHVTATGYSLNRISEMYKKVYEANNMRVLDWNTEANKVVKVNKQLSDGLHPTQATYDQLGLQYGKWLTGLIK